MKLLITKSLLLLTVVFSTSCEKENSEEITNTNMNTISSEILEKLEALSFNTKDVVIDDFLLPDGTSEKRYIIEGDIALTEDYILNTNLNGGVKSEQYRTSNLVRPRRLRILGFNGSTYGLPNNSRRGLIQAVNNYNDLDLSIPMSLEFGSRNLDNYDMVIYYDPFNPKSGGIAGFPSSGNPNSRLQIYGLANASVNINATVIAHEMGHSIGLRHTDWFSRQSCIGIAETGNEGSADVGVIRIPGTPLGYDPTSYMLACSRGETSGGFNENDKIALRFLY